MLMDHTFKSGPGFFLYLSTVMRVEQLLQLVKLWGWSPPEENFQE